MSAPPKLRTKVVLRSEETNGEVSMVDNIIPAGAAGPPLHKHGFDEAFYLLEGELVFQVEDELIRKRAGEMAFVPRGVVHALANQSDAEARYVLVCTPPGFERHFARMAAEQEGVDPPDWALQPTPEVEVVGPQIGDRSPSAD
jgi:quercetin dioxygenase-like cupin family protein